MITPKKKRPTITGSGVSLDIYLDQANCRQFNTTPVYLTDRGAFIDPRETKSCRQCEAKTLTQHQIRQGLVLANLKNGGLR